MIHRVIIAGSRDVDQTTARRLIEEEMLYTYPGANVILCGMARGVDTMGEWYGLSRGLAVEYYPANWDEDGKAAGFIRNRRMAENADGLLAVWDGVSRGTKDMIHRALDFGLEVRVVYV